MAFELNDILAAAEGRARMETEFASRGERIAAVLADLDRIPALHRRGVSHPDECGTCNEPYPCETVQAVIRIRATLTGEDPTDAH